MVVHWEGGLVMCGSALEGGLSDVWLCTGRGQLNSLQVLVRGRD